MRYFGITDIDRLYNLTLRNWNNMLEGKQYEIIDTKRINAEHAQVFAMANNGKKLSAYYRTLDLQESKIGKSEDEIKQSREVKKAVYKKQKADFAVWLAEREKENIEKMKKEREQGNVPESQ